MNFKIKGTIISISEIETLGSGASKLNFQLDTKEEYNNLYSFELFKNADNKQHIDNFVKYNAVGNEVEIEFSIRTNEYNGKYYTNLNMWRCENSDKDNSGGLAVDPNTGEVIDDSLPY